jgi:hypothetical protein
MMTDMASTIDYASPGPLTGLDGIDRNALDAVRGTPLDICSPVHALVIHPHETGGIDIPEERFSENQIRPAAGIVRALLALDPSPVDLPRRPEKRVVGTCRHFAVLSCALLRYRGISARVRCGFATYFHPGKGVDHWITEYWDDAEGRWIRVDSEVLGGTAVPHPEDLRPDEFLSGGEAWDAFRRGEIDGSQFGVYGTENWGPAEIRGNAVKDLAALNKVEMLPWDEWGRMTEAYRDETGADYDDLLDELAVVCAEDDRAELAALYARDELRVPETLIR